MKTGRGPCHGWHSGFSTDSFCVELVAVVDVEASNAKRTAAARTSEKDVCSFRTEVASPHSFEKHITPQLAYSGQIRENQQYGMLQQVPAGYLVF